MAHFQFDPDLQAAMKLNSLPSKGPLPRWHGKSIQTSRRGIKANVCNDVCSETRCFALLRDLPSNCPYFVKEVITLLKRLVHNKIVNVLPKRVFPHQIIYIEE